MSLERLLAMSTDATIVVPKKEDGVGVEVLRCCQGCATVKRMEELLKCKGCGTVWYCGRVGISCFLFVSCSKIDANET